ncbi:translation initiation factor IF-2, partial [Flavobacteriaceae bacterium]|nr:translation initiation factor IF-2 [Flavobacteriaceae bacterium]
MAEVKSIRLNKVLKEFNISLDRAVDFLKSKSIEIEARPTAKISDTEYKLLSEGFAKDKEKKVESKEVGEEKRKEKEELFNDREREREEQEKRKAEADAAAKLAAENAAAEKAA